MRPNARRSGASLFLALVMLLQSCPLAAFAEPQGGSVINGGATIQQGGGVTRDGGYVVLVAPLVNNEGTIIANLGKVTLAGNGRTVVSFDGEGLISYALPQGANGDVLITPEAMSQVVERVVGTAGQNVHTHGGSFNSSGVDFTHGGTTVTGGAITINHTGAVSTNTLSTNNVAGADIMLVDANALTLRSTSSSSGGTVSLQSNVALTGNGPISAGNFNANAARAASR